MNMPSRDFLLRQAILNAALTHKGSEEKNFGEVVRAIGVHRYLDCQTTESYVRGSFCEQVRFEFRALVKAYEEGVS